ncbi:MAG: sulfatase-like hydrolase/transferase [Candidatus Margulisiibacteriota bacterium]
MSAILAFWMVILIILAVIDIYYFNQPSINLKKSNWVLCIAIFTQSLLVLTIPLSIQLFKPGLLNYITPIITFTLGFTIVLNLHLIRAFKRILVPSLYRFILSEPKNWLYIKQFFKSTHGWLFISIWAIVTFFGFQINPQTPVQSYPVISNSYGLYLGLVSFMGIFILRPVVERYYTTLLVSTIMSIIKCIAIKKDVKTFHVPSQRTPVIEPRKSTASPPLNIVILLNESLCNLNSQDTKTYMPSHYKRLNNAQWISFSNCYTPSTLTMASLPALLTGIHPINAAKGFYSAPLLWDWAKANGMDTLLLSSQLYQYGNLDQFCFTESLDRHITREDFKFAPTVNDLGIDDLITIEMLPTLLNNQNQPFLAMIQTNNLHYPFLQQSMMLDSPPCFESPYHNALWLLDKTIERIMTILAPNLDNTIIFMTSDHGEDHQRAHNSTHRSSSFKKTNFNIPLQIYLPSSLQNSRIHKRLYENRKKVTTTLDIIPTIADILELSIDNHKMIHRLDGQSLLKPITDERFIIGSNYSPTVTNYNNAFGIAKKNILFTYSDDIGPAIYEKGKQINSWESNPELINPFHTIIKKNPILNQHYQKHSNSSNPITFQNIFKF